MSILTVSVLGITAVLLAVQLKGKGSEYGTYIVMAAGLCLFFYAAGKLEVILKTLRTMESCIGISPVYLSALFENGGNHLYCRICLRDLQGCRVRFAGNTD